MLGLLHSNENSTSYGDSTGYMSFGNKSAKYPKKCFNGLQNWQLGWYSDRQMVIDTVSDEESYLIKLATFVDFDKTKDDEPVLVKVLDQFYLQYNRAKGMNIDTEEKADQVTITAAGKGGSELLAGLAEGDQYTVGKFRGTLRRLIITACEIATNEAGADIMLVSVSLDGQSRCPDFYDEEWAATVTKIHSDLHLPDRDEGVGPANASRKDPAENSGEQGVGSNGFWDLFNGRHKQSPPNIDSLLKSDAVGGPAEPEPPSENELNETVSSSSNSSSSVLSSFRGKTELGEREGTDSLLSKYFSFASPKKENADCKSKSKENPDVPCITSVFEHLFRNNQP